MSGLRYWLRQRSAEENKRPIAKNKVTKKSANNAKKLSYKDQRELDNLPLRIEQLEAQISAISTTMSEPTFYQSDRALITQTEAALMAFEEEPPIAMSDGSYWRPNSTLAIQWIKITLTRSVV